MKDTYNLNQNNHIVSSSNKKIKTNQNKIKQI